MLTTKHPQQNNNINSQGEYQYKSSSKQQHNMSPTPLKEEGASTNDDGRDSATSAADAVVNNNNNGSVTPSPKPSSASSSPPSTLQTTTTTTNTNNAETPEQVAIRRRNQPLTNIMEPGPNDCLFGRGGGTNHHPGNKLYRQKVDDNKHKYLTSKRLDKPLVAMEIIASWRSMHPPGRFLKQDDRTKLWNDVGDKKAREKTSQALREKTPTKSRDDGTAPGSGSGGGLNHRARARFEPGISSPRPNTVSKGVLARDHSLGETGFGEDVNLEGFSWDDTAGNDDAAAAAVVVQDSDAKIRGEGRSRRGGAEQYPPRTTPREPQFREQYPHHQYPTQQPQFQERGGGTSPSHHPHHHYPPQHHYAPHPEEQYPYHREHSLSNNPLSDASVAHSVQPSAFGEHPGGYYGHPYPPPPPYESYPGHHPPPYHHPHHYPPHGYPPYGGPPPPPPSSSAGAAQQQHQYHHAQQQQQRAREHSLQSNPLSGASTTQPARDTFNDEESTSHASSSAAAAAYDDRMPPLPSPTYDSRGPPPPPPPPSYYQGGYEYASPRSPHGWPAPPPPPPHAAGEATTATAPSPQFSHHRPPSNGTTSAFGKYESSESSTTARNSMQSLGSSVDVFYDRRDSRSSASAAAAAAAVATNTKSSSPRPSSPSGGNGAKNTNNNNVTNNNVENPSSAGTSQDYSKIAELIRDSSDKTAGGSSSSIEKSNSMDAVSVAKNNEGGLCDDGIQRSKSDVGAMSSVAKDEGGNESSPRKSTSSKKSNSSSLMKKLSGGGMAILSNAVPPPNGIHRPSPMNPSDAVTTTGAVVLRPDPVKRDTSNQPETLETKRSIKRVVLGRDQSAVARRLKEEQYAAQQAKMQAQHGVTGRPLPMGVRASSRLSKAELLDRKLSVEINKLGLEDINENSKLAKAALHPGISMTMVGIAPLDRMTTEDVLASLIDDEGLDDAMLGSSPSPTLTEAIAEGQLDGQSAAPSSSSFLSSPQLIGERVTTIDAIAMDIANGNNSGTDNWDGGLDLIDEDTTPSGMTSPGVNADIAEKWLKGET